MGTVAATAGRHTLASRHHRRPTSPVHVRLEGHRPTLAIGHRVTIQDHRLAVCKARAFKSASAAARLWCARANARGDQPCRSSTAKPLRGADRIAFDADDLIMAGWTGRDAAAVEHHVAELAALGVPGALAGAAVLSARPGAAGGTGRGNPGPGRGDLGRGRGRAGSARRRPLGRPRLRSHRPGDRGPRRGAVQAALPQADGGRALAVRGGDPALGPAACCAPTSSRPASASSTWRARSRRCRRPEELIAAYVSELGLGAAAPLPPGTVMFMGAIAARGGIRPCRALRDGSRGPGPRPRSPPRL